jgi:hypothetical protein
MALNVSNLEMAQNFQAAKAPKLETHPAIVYGGRIATVGMMLLYVQQMTKLASEKLNISEKQATTAEFIIKRIVLEDIDFGAWLDDKLEQKGLTHDTTIERTDA